MITKDMTISEVTAKYPESIEIFFDYGLGCVGCPSAAYETIEQGMAKHGLGPEVVTELVDRLNEELEEA
jgi:hybrid cluster-associated redox disulfide protein